MLRSYFSLAFPVMLSAVAALSYLHVRREGQLAAAPVLQVAQAAPADPFAPPADPPAVKPADPAVPAAPAEAKPIDPANPPKKLHLVPTPRRSRVARRANPTKDDEVRTPFLRSLLGQLDTFTEVSAEDRDGVRQMIYDADVEMSESMGPNARRRIEAANQKRGFVVGPSAPYTATDPTIKRKDVLVPLDQPIPGERPMVERPAAPAPTPMPVPPPKKDVFDDLFKPE